VFAVRKPFDNVQEENPRSKIKVPPEIQGLSDSVIKFLRWAFSQTQIFLPFFKPTQCSPTSKATDYGLDTSLRHAVQRGFVSFPALYAFVTGLRATLMEYKT
jgi:hypothetical protein